MRRILVAVLLCVISGLVLASAASLEIDGGTIQTYRLDLQIPSTVTSTTTTSVGSG